MVGFYTDPLGAVALEEQGLDAVTAPTGDVLSATMGSALAHNFTPRLLRAPLGGGFDAETRSFWQGQNDPRTADSDINRMEEERGPAQQTLTSDEANQRFGIAGVLSFDRPVPEAVASDLHEHKYDELVRQNTINRRGSGIGNGALARGVAGLAMGLLDPVNLAAAFVPGFGEARIAGAFGMDLAASLGARVTARALAGGSAGAAGMAALEPLNYILDQHEHNDWTAGEALRDIAFGALLGGGLHTAIGGLVGKVPERVRAADPETQAMMVRGAVAQVAEGRPVDIASALSLMEANAARSELAMFQRRSMALADAIDAAEARTRIVGASDSSLRANEVRLEQLRAEADALHAEMRDALASVRVESLDEPSRLRLNEIDAELDRTIPRARRESLERERELLVEGRGEMDVAAAGLEAARSAAQAQGLSAALERKNKEISRAEKEVAKFTRLYDLHQSVVEEHRGEAQTNSRIVTAKAEGQQAILQHQSERVIQRYAASLGVALKEGEAARIAREVLTAQRGESADILNHALNDIATRSPRPEIEGVVSASGIVRTDGVFDALNKLTAETTLAERTLRDAALRPVPPNDIMQSARTNATTRLQALKVEGGAAKEIAELHKATEALTTRIQTEAAAGRLDEVSIAEMKAADAALAMAERDAQAYEAAAACLATRIV